MKILLAEDNAVNRKLAIRLLEKHGHTVVATENGRAALDAIDRERFDLVLMDVQMPVMDGLEAIRNVRAIEQRTGAHLPIIALTAHAMKGDRERCLEVGADDYLTKPIRSAALFAALDQLANPPATNSAEICSRDFDASAAWDNEAALARMEGDRDLLSEIIHLFMSECPRACADLRQALDARDARLLERLAHTLKGSSANISATGVCQAALALEMQARSGELKDAALKIDTIEEELHRLLAELEAWPAKVAHEV